MGSDSDNSPESHPTRAGRHPAWSTLAILLIGGLTLLFQLPFFDRWFSFMDEGHMVQYADLVAKGGVLYRDALIYPLPGAFYLLAAVFRIFGASILVSRWVVAVEFSIFTALIFVLLRGVVRPGFALIGVLLTLLYRVWSFPHWQIYSYSTTALLLLLGALVLVLRFVATGRHGWLVLAGLAAGLAVFCKQDYGGVGLVALSFTLVVSAGSPPAIGGLSRRAVLCWFLAPVVLVGFAAGVHFLREGTLHDVIAMTFLNPFRAISHYGFTSFPPLFPLLGQDPLLRSNVGRMSYLPSIVVTAGIDSLGNPWVRDTAILDAALKLFYYGPWLLLTLGGVRLVRRRDLLRSPTTRLPYLHELAIFALAIALIGLVWAHPPQDYLHLAVLYWPLLCLVVIYADALLRGRRLLTWTVAIVLALPAIVVARDTVGLVQGLRSDNSTPAPGERAGIYVEARSAAVLGSALAYIDAHLGPNDPLTVLPYFPILHFLANRSAPQRLSYIVWPYGEVPGRDRQIIDAIEETHTDTVIYSFTQFASFPPVEEYAPELYSYLVENFDIDRVFSAEEWGSYRLAALRRAREPVRGRPLVTDGSTDAGVYVEDRAGLSRAISDGQRAEYFQRTVWPFRPVWAVRPTADGGRTRLVVPLTVPPGARLRTAIGAHPTFWIKVWPSWVRFEIDVEGPDGREPLFRRTLDPHRTTADRGWFEVDLDLGRYAGKAIDLVFSTAGENEIGETLLMGGFAEPRLLTEPEGSSPSSATSGMIGR